MTQSPLKIQARANSSPGSVQVQTLHESLSR